MSFFEKLFGGSKRPSEQSASSPVSNIPAQETPSIQDVNSKPLENNPIKIRQVIDIRTNKPIDAVYVYIKTDYEERGYNDAITLSDVSYMNKGVSKITNELRVLFKQVRLKYDEALKDVENKIALYESMFMASSLKDAQAKMDLIKSHLDELTQLEKDLDSNAPSMQNMIDSYQRGFMTGIMAKDGVVTKPLSAPLSTANVGNGINSTVTTIG